MVQSSTTNFLSQLKTNNSKTWFDLNKAKYISAKSDFENLVEQVISKVSAFDEDIKTLKPRNCTFRINRDIRFSKDKTPYKSNMGAYFNKGGKKSPYGGYYFHLEPGEKSFVAAGVWMPQPGDLRKVRQEIDYCYAEFKKIISNFSFRKYFGDLTKEKGQMLVNVPKGYEKENPAADYLKLKNFVAVRSLADSKLFLPSLAKEIADSFRSAMPLVKFMNRALD